MLQPHPLAEKAAEATLRARDQGKFWELHDRFFAKQGTLAMDKMLDHGTALGLDTDSFLKCLDQNKYENSVSSDLAEGHELGVQGTPTFFIGVDDTASTGRIRARKSIVGNYPFAEFQKAIEETLSESGHKEARR